VNEKKEVEALDLFGFTPKEKEHFGLINDWLVEKMQNAGGCICPLCKQRVKLYLRTINKSMVKGLVLIYKYFLTHDKNVPLHIEGYLKRCRVSSAVRGDITKLRYWGLIKRYEKIRTEPPERRGKYWITPDGEAFVRGTFKVRRYAKVFNKKFYGFEGDEIGISDAMKQVFDYDAEMARSVEMLDD
jgi:hypothetical protein